MQEMERISDNLVININPKAKRFLIKRSGLDLSKRSGFIQL
jgi:hypothetical protein